MLQQCHENKLVVPSLESLIAGPTVSLKSHMVFYHICVKTVAGSVLWRNALKESFVKAGCFGTPTDFAFAYIILENNYKSWMRKASDHQFDLVTEYDNQESWKGRKFYIDWKIRSEYDSHSIAWDSYCVKEKEGDKFERVRTVRREAFLDGLYETIKGKFEYGKNCEETTLTLLATTAAASPTESSNMKRKRVQQRDHKKYTKGGSGRKRFGGWSDEGHQRLEAVARKVKAGREGGDYTYLEHAIHLWQREEMEVDASSDEEEDTGDRHMVDRSAAWDL
jgi:hypothetical protein